MSATILATSRHAHNQRFERMLCVHCEKNTHFVNYNWCEECHPRMVGHVWLTDKVCSSKHKCTCEGGREFCRDFKRCKCGNPIRQEFDECGKCNPFQKGMHHWNCMCDRCRMVARELNKQPSQRVSLGKPIKWPKYKKQMSMAEHVRLVNAKAERHQALNPPKPSTFTDEFGHVTKFPRPWDEVWDPNVPLPCENKNRPIEDDNSPPF